MYVGLKMIKKKDLATITRETLVMDAEKLMNNERLWLVLVLDGEKLVGCVRKEDVLEALPSRATTLSKHELNYVLSELTVEKIVNKDVPTIRPEATIEEAARKMDEENRSGLAVVDENKRLLGYINRTVMLEVLVEEMGLAQGGSRIVLEVEDRKGVLKEVSTLIADMGISILSTSTFYHDGRRMIVLRVGTTNTDPIKFALTERGYAIVTADTFRSEWER